MTKLQKQFLTLPAVILFTLLLGIFFRFYHLDYKVYWHDEVFTSVRATGQTGESIGKRLEQQGIFRAGDLRQYQQLRPDHGWDDTLTALQGHPEHPPLYYLGTRLWMELFGSSVAATRSFAAVISLLTFPCLYWLCLELFASRLAGGVAIALFAVSPFQVLYAQEARQYSLWTVLVLLSSAVLLWARRESTPKKWVAYSATVALGLYTSLFFIFTLLSHGLYILLVNGIRHKVMRFYAIATSMALFSFIPWLIVIVRHKTEFEEKTAWTKSPASLDFLAKLWGLHISSGFLDPGFPLEHPYTYLIPPFFVALVLGAGWVVCRKTAKQVWLFILLMIGVNVGMLVLPDLVFGGLRSASSRYYVPTYIGVQLLVSFWVAYGLSHSRVFMQRVGRFMFAGLLILGVVSCAISSQTAAWWNKGLSYNNPAAAQIVNQADRPLVLLNTTGDTLGNAISLSYLLKPDVALQLVKNGQISEIPAAACDVFLYYPSEQLSQNVKQLYAGRVEFVEVENELVHVQRSGVDCNRLNRK
ncbi:MAG: hypothetical protein Kow00121_49250 [Elainellaceae cyanobacterium]